MKLFECTGLPCSGKTTLFPILKEYLKKQGLNVFDREDVILQKKLNEPVSKLLMTVFPPTIKKWIGLKLYTLRNMESVCQIKYVKENMDIINYIYEINRIRPISEFDKKLVMKWFIETVSIYFLSCDTLDNNSIVMLDEGFFHKIVNLFVSIEEDTVNLEGIKEYLKEIPPIDILFKIDTDLDECIRRSDLRGVPRRLRNKSRDAVSDYFHKSKYAIDKSICILEERGTKVIELKNSEERKSVNDIPINYLNIKNYI